MRAFYGSPSRASRHRQRRGRASLAVAGQAPYVSQSLAARRSPSKLLSYVLRHAPEAFGLTLQRGGWVDVERLLCAFAEHGVPLEHDELVRIVAADEKQRFALASDGRSIRANQGHSCDVALDLVAQSPPNALYHGSVERFWPSIAREGLRRGDRHHVHLSIDVALARKVGARRGPPLVLEVRARDMADGGYTFYRSANGVWLTDHVPPAYLRRLPTSP